MADYIDPASCQHGEINFRTTMGRVQAEGNFLVVTSMKCVECGTDFYWYGINATGDPTANRPTVSDDRRQLQIFVGPQESMWGIPTGQLRQ